MINLIAAYFFWAAVVLFSAAAAISVIYASLSFAPWVPSRGRDLNRILKMADLKPGQVFYELGCGTGKITLTAAKNYGAKAVGLEISLPLYFICCFKSLISRGDASFKLKNIFKENLAPAEVVYFFSIPGALKQSFTEKLKRELKPGAKVISYAFKLNGWQPVAINKPSAKDLPIYLYKI